MQSITLWPIILALGIACFTDIRSRRIPNALVLPFAVSGLVINGMLQGLTGLGRGLEGLGLAAVVCGVFCYLRGMGMGDLKLCAAIGAWIGPQQMAFALVMTFIAGALIGIVWALCTGTLSKSLDSTGNLLSGFAKNGIKPHDTIVLDNPETLKIPYAPAIAFGTLFSFLASNAGV
jgi:prepilin peptidase CpaA